MGKLSKRKGARGEREFAKLLTKYGFPASRGVQYQGGPNSPDVVCDSLPIHWEVKRVEKLNIESAMKQAISDSYKKTPVVAHRKNGKEWLITMRAEDFLKLL